MTYTIRTAKEYKRAYDLAPVVYPGKRARTRQSYNIKTKAGYKRAFERA